jgi:hypothetical protein
MQQLESEVKTHIQNPILPIDGLIQQHFRLASFSRIDWARPINIQGQITAYGQNKGYILESPDIVNRKKQALQVGFLIVPVTASVYSKHSNNSLAHSAWPSIVT